MKDSANVAAVQAIVSVRNTCAATQRGLTLRFAIAPRSVPQAMAMQILIRTITPHLPCRYCRRQ